METRPSLIPEECGALVNKVNAGECVLVLGPRLAMPSALCPERPTAIDEYLAARLEKTLGEAPPTPASLREVMTRYEQVKGGSRLRSHVQQLVGALDEHTTDVHRHLASLPFRLVLSATPDRMMANAFRAAGKAAVREAHYDYCAVAPAPPQPLPAVDAPVVYSLFGRHDHPESMVLGEHNLIDYLVRLTRESPPLPDYVRATLKQPSTVFLFVGFGFASWWLRMLLKVLDVIGVENRLISLAVEDSATFASAATRDNKGFFESAGIYIQAGDWAELAADLASRYAAKSEQRRAPTAAPAASRPVLAGRPPLVFLSYASEDLPIVTGLREGLESHGISVWQDKQDLRAGQNWEAQIAEFIKRVDYFVFLQTEQMDRRDAGGGGVYNGELKMALKHAHDRLPENAVFVLHVTIGACQPRPERALADLHRFRLDVDGGVDALAGHILEAFAASGKGAAATAGAV